MIGWRTEKQVQEVTELIMKCADVEGENQRLKEIITAAYYWLEKYDDLVFGKDWLDVKKAIEILREAV